jgi:hypothetical protein
MNLYNLIPLSWRVAIANSLKDDTRVWTTADREYMKLSDMSFEHIQNSIRYCLKHRFRKEFIPFLEKELMKR